MKSIRKMISSDTFIVFLSNVVSRVLAFSLFYFYAKILGAESYGMLALVLVFVTTIVEMSSAGINSSLIRFTAINFDNERYLNRLLSTSFFNIALVGLLIFIAISILKEYIFLYFLKHSEQTSLVYVSCLAIFLSLYYGQFSSYLIGSEKYYQYSFMVIGLQVIRFFFVLILYFIYPVGVTVEGVVWSIILSNFLIVLFSYSYSAGVIRIRYYDTSINKKTFKFGGWMLAWSIVVIVQSKMEFYFISNQLSLTDVANYDVAIKFISVLMIVFTSYSAVLKPKLSKLKSLDLIITELRHAVLPLFFILLIISISSVLLPLVAFFLYGNDFLDAKFLMYLMIPSLLIYVLTLPLNSIIFALGFSKYFFYIALIELCAKYILLSYLIPKFGLTGAAYTYIAMNFLSVILSVVFYLVMRVNFKYENSNICH